MTLFKWQIMLRVLSLLVLPSAGLSQSHVAVKSNLLYGGLTLTPNAGVEIALGDRSTLDLWAGYNPWNRKGNKENNKKMVHWIIQPEYRHWLCERFNGHFFGVHAIYAYYNIGERRIPLLLENQSKEYRYQGHMYGAGLAYGHQWMLGQRWNLECTVGAGYLLMEYDKYKCRRCSDKMGRFRRSYVGPTKLGVTLIFLIR